MNLVALEGTLGRNAELKYTTTGKAVTEFSLAVDNGYGQNKKEPFWFTIKSWGELAETLGNLTKGTKVSVYGRLTTRSWEKDGQKRTVTEIVANAVEIRDVRKTDAKPAAKPQVQEIPEEDLPF